MMSKRKVQASPESPIRFGLNMRHREVVIQFDIFTQQHQQRSVSTAYGRLDTMILSISFRQMQNIYLVEGPVKVLKLLITLETPPKFFKKVEGTYGLEEGARQWTEKDLWYRQTDLVRNQAKLKTSPVTLKRIKPIIDLGMSSLSNSVSRPLC